MNLLQHARGSVTAGCQPPSDIQRRDDVHHQPPGLTGTAQLRREEHALPAVQEVHARGHAGVKIPTRLQPTALLGPHLLVNEAAHRPEALPETHLLLAPHDCKAIAHRGHELQLQPTIELGAEEAPLLLEVTATHAEAHALRKAGCWTPTLRARVVELRQVLVDQVAPIQALLRCRDLLSVRFLHQGHKAPQIRDGNWLPRRQAQA
mmetsp:Transcript_10652/g.25048  ORF Transcript_10652/g.25048 Transcript_10652/m.25048 type:complete len:206 (+) Transcript_10652:1122-1739(+)